MRCLRPIVTLLACVAGGSMASMGNDTPASPGADTLQVAITLDAKSPGRSSRSIRMPREWIFPC
jgi:hypothetical protein